jgi:hypothetical protein
MGILLVAVGIISLIVACCEEIKHHRDPNRAMKDLRDALGYSIR